MRCALHSTPSAKTTMSVMRASRQSEASSEWCGSPPRSMSLGVAAAALGAVSAPVCGAIMFGVVGIKGTTQEGTTFGNLEFVGVNAEINSQPGTL